MKIDDLQNQLKKSEELIVNKALGWIAVTRIDGDQQKTRKIFIIKSNGELERVPYTKLKKKLIKAIMERIDIDRFVQLVLNESLDTSLPDSFLNLVERVLKKEAEVKQRPGCVELEIGGKRGPHLHYRIM